MSQGRSLLELLKASARPGRAVLGVAAGMPVHSLLRPVSTAPESVDGGEVTLLTRWRNAHVSAYLSRFVATDNRTAEWLTTVVEPASDRILFTVQDLTGRAYGAMGIASIDWDAGSYEVDGVVRGEEPPQRSAMSDALDAMVAWASAQLELEVAIARVFADSPAVRFYECVGFECIREVGLVLKVEGDTETWIEDADAPAGAPVLLHMSRRAQGDT